MPSTLPNEQPATLPRKPWNPLRFSLRTLLTALTLAAIASWALSSGQLDRDESWLLLCWLGGLILGISLGRWRQRSGIVEGALGGSIGCLVASSIVRELHLPDGVWVARTEYLVFSIPTGFAIAGVIAAIIWFLFDLRLDGRYLRWRRICCGVVFSLSFLAIAAWGYVRSTQWSPRLELPNRYAILPNGDQRVIESLSPQGNYLIVRWVDVHQSLLQTELLQVEQRRFQRLNNPALPKGAVSFAFAPDESWLAFLATGRLEVIDLKGKASQSLAVQYPGYDITGQELTVSRDGAQIFANWHSPLIQRRQAFAHSKLRKNSSQYFSFKGRMFVSPSGKWLVKMHYELSPWGQIQWDKPVRTEIVRAADLQVVREQRLEAAFSLPDDRTTSGYHLLQDVINEMFPDSHIRLALEGNQLTIRGFARDTEESNQIVALVRSQVLHPVGGPDPAKPANNGAAPWPVISLLENLSYVERPLFDPDETRVAFRRQVVSLAESPAQSTTITLPGEVAGLLPNGKALVAVDSAPAFSTRLPFLRHWFPEELSSNLCIIDIDTGEVLRTSRRQRWLRDSQLGQDCRVAVTADSHNTLQVWDIPQVD